MGSATLREFTFLEFWGMPVKLRLRIDSTAARGIIQRQRVRSSQAHCNETLVASSETRGEKVDCGQGTDSNEYSRWIHEVIADSEVSVMAEPSQHGIRQG